MLPPIALDQLAWNLAHLDADRIRRLKPGQMKKLSFPISSPGDTNYSERKSLFPSTVADLFDRFQPYLRGDTYRDHPLWQLDELWRLDKHIMIPVNCNALDVSLPVRYYLMGYSSDNRMVVRISMADAWLSPVHLKPEVTPHILFGEYMGVLDISVSRLREIYDFVCDEVIPTFSSFFS